MFPPGGTIVGYLLVDIYLIPSHCSLLLVSSSCSIRGSSRVPYNHKLHHFSTCTQTNAQNSGRWRGATRRRRRSIKMSVHRTPRRQKVGPKLPGGRQRQQLSRNALTAAKSITEAPSIKVARIDAVVVSEEADHCCSGMRSNGSGQQIA